MRKVVALFTVINLVLKITTQTMNSKQRQRSKLTAKREQNYSELGPDVPCPKPSSGSQPPHARGNLHQTWGCQELACKSTLVLVLTLPSALPCL